MFRKEESCRNERENANEEAERDFPFSREPSEQKREGKNAKQGAVNRPHDRYGLVVTALGSIEHGSEEKEPREAFYGRDQTESVDVSTSGHGWTNQ